MTDEPDDWTTRGVCRELDPVTASRVFFPEHGEGPGAYDEARTYCDRCPVHVECLEYIMANEAGTLRYGMWGRKSPPERRKLGTLRVRARRVQQQEQAA